MYLVKSFVTCHGITASTWDINTVTIKRVGNVYQASGNISLYWSNTERLNGSSIIENCLFCFDDLTELEINSNTLEVLYNRVTTSNMKAVVLDPATPEVTTQVESNVYNTSCSGEVCFVGSTLIP
jgi:hypothetical protein